MWPALANGGVTVSGNMVYIPDGNKIYIQSRLVHDEKKYRDVDVDGHNYFTIRKLLINKTNMYVDILYTDGMIYLYKIQGGTSKNIGLISKHAVNDRMIQYSDGKVISTGIYRPNYAKVLNKYDDDSTPGSTPQEERKYKELYENSRAFSLAIYSQDLELIDSANFIDRTGENAQAFDRLFVRHPVDLTDQDKMFIIDNMNGYEVKIFDKNVKHIRTFPIHNKSFKPIPAYLTLKQAQKLRSDNGKYSVAYALYVKGDKVITSFCQSYVGRDLPKPPYHYDVSTLEGKPLGSGEINYPIISEDDEEKIFLLVVMDGGWLGENQYYLVGMTIDELMAGMGAPASIEHAIDKYLEGSR